MLLRLARTGPIPAEFLWILCFRRTKEGLVVVHNKAGVQIFVHGKLCIGRDWRYCSLTLYSIHAFLLGVVVLMIRFFTIDSGVIGNTMLASGSYFASSCVLLAVSIDLLTV
jgi:hypothetical protein